MYLMTSGAMIAVFLFALNTGGRNGKEGWTGERDRRRRHEPEAGVNPWVRELFVPFNR